MNKFEKKYLKYKSKYISSKINLKGGVEDISSDNTSSSLSLSLSKDFKQKCEVFKNKLLNDLFKEGYLEEIIKELTLNEEDINLLKDSLSEYDKNNVDKNNVDKINELINSKFKFLRDNPNETKIGQLEFLIKSTNNQNYTFHNKSKTTNKHTLTINEDYEYDECIKLFIFKILLQKYVPK